MNRKRPFTLFVFVRYCLPVCFKKKLLRIILRLIENTFLTITLLSLEPLHLVAECMFLIVLIVLIDYHNANLCFAACIPLLAPFSVDQVKISLLLITTPEHLSKSAKNKDPVVRLTQPMKSFRVSSFNPAPIRNIVIMGQLEHKGLESQSSLFCIQNA